MVLARGAALLGLALASGCVSPRFTCPAQGGPEWREVATPHLLVRTDLGRRDALRLAQELERLHEGVRRGFFRNPPHVPGPLLVTAFRNRAEFEAFAPPRAEAYYLQKNDSDPPVVVLHGPIDLRTRERIAHELSHHTLAQVFKRMPLWFAEGMAVYMETIAARGAFIWSEDPTVGGLPRAAAGVTSSPARVRSVLTATRFLTGPEYAVAWALVHYISNHRIREFADLQHRLAAAEDPAAAWRAVFPQWDPASDAGMADLDRHLRAYMQGGKYRFHVIQLGAPPEVKDRPLPPPRVHAVRLELPRFTFPRPGEDLAALRARLRAEALAECDEALAEDATELGALVVRADLVPTEALAMARRAIEAHPRDPRAWRLAARALPEDDHAGREAALRHALEVAPDDASAQTDLADALVGLGRPGEALPLLDRAAARMPFNPWPFHARALALLALGRCAEALGAQRRAAEIVAGRLEEEWAAPISKQLGELEQRCAPPPASPTATGDTTGPPRSP